MHRHDAAVSYIWSQQLEDVANDLPSNIGRSSVVHSLVRELGLLDDIDSQVVELPGSDGCVKESDERREVSTASHTPDLLESATSCRRARVVKPDMTLGTRDRLLRYHSGSYVGSY